MTYTTGELAKLCEVSVRTVQYYDAKGVLSPSFLSQGGRRLYTDEDLGKMKLVCFLRELDLSLGSIAEIMKEDNSEKVISCILSEQERALSSEIADKKEKLLSLQELRAFLKSTKSITPNAIGRVADMMKTKKELKRMRMAMLLSAIPLVLFEAIGIVLGITSGIWWPCIVAYLCAIPYAVWVSVYYFKRVDYVCPECNHVFHPKTGEIFFAQHTPKTRKLRCPSCHHKGFCVEIYHKEEK